MLPVTLTLTESQRTSLHRHLFPDEHGGHFHRVQGALNGTLRKHGYVYAGVDYLADVVQKALKDNARGAGQCD